MATIYGGVHGARFISGRPENPREIPSIPGFKVVAREYYWLTATGKGREWFVLDRGTHWVLAQLIRGGGAKKIKPCDDFHPVLHDKSAPRVDDQNAIAIPK